MVHCHDTCHEAVAPSTCPVRSTVVFDKDVCNFSIAQAFRATERACATFDWTVITLTVAYVLLVAFALWVGLAH